MTRRLIFMSGTDSLSKIAVVGDPRRASARRESKTARFLALIAERHGELAGIDPANVSQICTDLAPQVDLDIGAARSALLPRVRQAIEAAQTGGRS